MASDNSVKHFQAVQAEFTQHMRDPDVYPAPGNIEERRLKIYRRLIYNNIQNFLANSFPVLRKILTDDEWHSLIGDYLRQHQAQTPLFPKMPQEFLKFLEEQQPQPALFEKYSFIQELAHYEWMETAVMLDSRDIDISEIDKEGDLLSGIPVINPLAVPLAYAWPVHELSPDYLPDDAPELPTYIVVYRDEDDKVGFMLLNNVSARLVDLIQNNSDNRDAKEMLLTISQELNHTDPNVVINGGLTMLEDMRKKQIILGVKKSHK